MFGIHQVFNLVPEGLLNYIDKCNFVLSILTQHKCTVAEG